MAILAQYRPLDIPVRIVNVYQNGRTRVLIQALLGQPFTQQTHGGPVDTDCTLTSLDLLSNIHQDPEPLHTYGKYRRSWQPGAARPEPVYVPFEDAQALAPFFPIRARNIQTSRGGVNND